MPQWRLGQSIDNLQNCMRSHPVHQEREITMVMGEKEFDLHVHVVVELDLTLQAVCPLVWVPVWNRLALKLGHHCSAHRFVTHILRGSIWKVEDLLVQPGGLLCCQHVQ